MASRDPPLARRRALQLEVGDGKCQIELVTRHREHHPVRLDTVRFFQDLSRPDFVDSCGTQAIQGQFNHALHAGAASTAQNSRWEAV